MNTPIVTNSFNRCAIASLFAGLIAAVANLLFVTIYRSSTRVNAYEEIISPVPIGIGFPIILLVAGVIYYVMSHYLPRGIVWYKVLFVSLILFAVFYDFISGNNTFHLTGAKGLLLGIEVITGLMITFLIPYLAQHPKLFMTEEGIKYSK